MSRTTHVALIGMGLLLLGFVLVFVRARPEMRSSSAIAPVAAREFDSSAKEVAASGTLSRTEVSSEFLVQVMDAETKSGIPRASALKMRAPDSKFAADVLGKWASVEHSTVAIPVAELGGGSWRFRAEGYSDQLFLVDPPPIVELKKSGRILIRLKTIEDLPAVGVPVMAFRQQVPTDYVQGIKYEDALPWLDASRAISVGITDSEGLAILGGMAEGSYGLCLGGIDHALVELDPEVVELRRQDVMVAGRVTFVGAFVATCSGGRLLDMRPSPAVVGSETGEFAPEAIRARRWLERRFPGARAVAICKPRPMETYAPDEWDEVAVTAEGWKTWSTKVRMKRPSLVELQDVAGGERVDYGRLQVDIQTPSGARPVGIDLSVALVSQNDNSLFKGVPMMSGVEFPLPPGEYNVTTWTPLLRFGPLSATVKSHESTRVSVLCEREVRGLRLAIHAGGAVPRFAQIGLSGVGWRGMKFGAYDPRAVHCAGIVGLATLSVHVYGYEPFEREVIIQEGTEIQDIEVRLP